MRITVRTDDDRYVELILDPSKKEIIFIDPVPNVDQDEIFQFVDETKHTVILPISEEQIVPDKEDKSKVVKRPLLETLYFLTALSDVIVAEN